jgi:hypothetical protein
MLTRLVVLAVVAAYDLLGQTTGCRVALLCRAVSLDSVHRIANLNATLAD